jgi:hypothetical protein
MSDISCYPNYDQASLLLTLVGAMLHCCRRIVCDCLASAHKLMRAQWFMHAVDWFLTLPGMTLQAPPL